MGSSNDKLSDAQLSALADAVSERLHLYRRGYARSKLGPFHARRTIEALERNGFVVVQGVTPKAKATASGRKQLANQFPTTASSSTAAVSLNCRGLAIKAQKGNSEKSFVQGKSSCKQLRLLTMTVIS